MPTEIQHHPGPDGVPGNGGTAPARGQWYAFAATDREHRGHLIGMVWAGDHQWSHPIQRGVRRVRGARGVVGHTSPERRSSAASDSAAIIRSMLQLVACYE